LSLAGALLCSFGETKTGIDRYPEISFICPLISLSKMICSICICIFFFFFFFNLFILLSLLYFLFFFFL
jgi:hypothetical protein